VLDEIIDHAKDNTAITIADGYTTSYNGNRVPKQTTKGWKLLCQWRDGSSTWVPLVDLKDSNPVELAEYPPCSWYPCPSRTLSDSDNLTLLYRSLVDCGLYRISWLSS
jgi:hypothetical protein